jgi:uncharacterized protein YukE
MDTKELKELLDEASGLAEDASNTFQQIVDRLDEEIERLQSGKDWEKIEESEDDPDIELTEEQEELSAQVEALQEIRDEIDTVAESLQDASETQVEWREIE